jgi:hypothetical protein
MKRYIFIIIVIFSLFFTGCSSYSKYPEEIKLAYDSIHPSSQKTIKDWKEAKVQEFTPDKDLEVTNEEDKQINIKGFEIIEVAFNTTDEESLGPIVVYLDKDTRKVLGSGLRK